MPQMYIYIKESLGTSNPSALRRGKTPSGGNLQGTMAEEWPFPWACKTNAYMRVIVV